MAPPCLPGPGPRSIKGDAKSARADAEFQQREGHVHGAEDSVEQEPGVRTKSEWPKHSMPIDPAESLAQLGQHRAGTTGGPYGNRVVDGRQRDQQTGDQERDGVGQYGDGGPQPGNQSARQHRT